MSGILLVLLALAPPALAQEGHTVLPGGMKALAFAAEMRSNIPPDLFVLEYCQAIQSNTQIFESKDYINKLHRYFQAMESLRKAMTSSPNGLDTTLDVTTLPGFYKTRDIFKLMGWTVSGELIGDISKPTIGKIAVALGTGTDDAERQVFSAGFGVDFSAAKKALQASEPFKLHIPYDTIPIRLDETFWFGQVMSTKPPSGGLLEALADRLAAVRLYVALGSMTTETRDVLLKTVGAASLAKNYSDLLAVYGSSLSVRNDQLEVPGGASAQSVWEKLVGTSPGKPGIFMEAMLRKDSGKALAYFHALSELPLARQQFFALSTERLASFYAAFPFSEKDLLRRHFLMERDTMFDDIARETPLDSQGGLAFPGGKAVWAPNQKDDQAFLSLLGGKSSESFLEVVRLERAWQVHMDEPTARLLASNFAKYRSLYPYLFSLPPMNAQALSRVFAAADAIDALAHSDRDQLEPALAQFHGMLSLLAILSDSGGLANRDTVLILASFCEGFARDGEPRTALALKTLQQVVQATRTSGAISADDKLLDAITGKAATTVFKSGDRSFTIDRAAWHRGRVRGVLEAQTLTPVQVLLDLYADLQVLSREPERIQAIEQTSSKLRDVPSSTDGKAIPLLVAELRANPNTIGETAAELTEALTPFLDATLVGWSYAYYGSPDDLAISQDPTFVRRHRFVNPVSLQLWDETNVRNCGTGGGLCVVGGLAELGLAAGSWGRTKTNAEESLRSSSVDDAALQAQLTSIRTMPWARVSAASLKSAGLQLRKGKEMIALAATDATLRADVEQRLLGTVGSFRRLEITRLLNEGNSAAALDLLSSTDLYSLAGGEGDFLGGSRFRTQGSVRPQAISPAPCEKYEHLERKEQLWECSGHVVLDLVDAAEREGIPPDAIAVLAEAALHQLANGVEMRNSNDWLSVTRALRRLSLIEVLPVLEKSWQN